MNEHPGLVLLGMLVFIVGMFGIAFYLSGQDGVESRGGVSSKPVKKFRAKEGTERENARALISSQPSVKEETSKKDIDVWGSLDHSDSSSTSTESTVRGALAEGRTEDGIRSLLDRLEESEAGDDQSLVYTGLAVLYGMMDPPMTEALEQALALAWEHAVTPLELLEVAYAQATYDLSRGADEDVLATIGRLEDVPPSAHGFELGVMAGIAYERLGRADEARAAYEGVVAEAEALGLADHPSVVGVYRQASLNLAVVLRRQGEESDARALARRVQRNLEF